MADNEPVRVAIIGGGIGGVALAAFTSKLTKGNTKSRITIDIYEANPSLTEFGAGVGMWIRTWKIMQEYGDALTSSLSNIVPAGRDLTDNKQLAFTFRTGSIDASGVGNESLTFYELWAPFGVLALHRAGLQTALASQVDPECPIRFHFSKRLARHETRTSEGRDCICMKFEDGAEAFADVLIGADGIHSSVRDTMYEPPIGIPFWTGTIVYRSLIKCDDVLKLFPAGHPSLEKHLVYFGKNKHILTYPIKTPNASAETPDVINLVAFCSKPDMEGSKFQGPWMRPVERSVILQEFHDWDSDVAGLLKAVSTVSLWAIHVIPELPAYTRGAVCLLGDAAHAMAPHQGAGGGQAIEDAHVLAHLLTHPSISRKSVSSALKVYDSVRRPIAREIARRSRLNGMMYELNASFAEQDDTLSQEERLANLGRSIEEIHDWEWRQRDAASLPDGRQQVIHAIELFEASNE